MKPIKFKKNNDEKYFSTSTNNDNLESVNDDPEFQCELYIRNVDLDKMLILIVSEKTTSDLIRRAHPYSQIKAIFIVSSTEYRNALLANWSNYVKVNYKE